MVRRRKRKILSSTKTEFNFTSPFRRDQTQQHPFDTRAVHAHDFHFQPESRANIGRNGDGFARVHALADIGHFAK
jgi:hypothetical protein